MGQAKHRKNEIAALKATAPHQIIMFGAFYKDLEDEGFSLVLQRAGRDKQQLIDVFYSAMRECANCIKQEIAEGTWTIEGVTEQLEDAIGNFNQKQWAGAPRPKAGTDCTVNFVDSLSELTVIFGNIWALTELGVLANDNYNGMQFAYH